MLDPGWEATVVRRAGRQAREASTQQISDSGSTRRSWLVLTQTLLAHDCRMENKMDSLKQLQWLRSVTGEAMMVGVGVYGCENPSPASGPSHDLF